MPLESIIAATAPRSSPDLMLSIGIKGTGRAALVADVMLSIGITETDPRRRPRFHPAARARTGPWNDPR
jgi:hypothetical protein